MFTRAVTILSPPIAVIRQRVALADHLLLHMHSNLHVTSYKCTGSRGGGLRAPKKPRIARDFTQIPQSIRRSPSACCTQLKSITPQVTSTQFTYGDNLLGSKQEEHLALVGVDTARQGGEARHDHCRPRLSIRQDREVPKDSQHGYDTQGGHLGITRSEGRERGAGGNMGSCGVALA